MQAWNEVPLTIYILLIGLNIIGSNIFDNLIDITKI